MFGSLRAVTALVGCTMLVTTAAAGAQTVTSGAAVRWHEGATLVKARVHEPAADGKLIVQRRDGSRVTIDPSATPMEYRTNGRTVWGSVGIGFGVGAGIGAIAGLLSGDDDCGTTGFFAGCFAITAGEKAVIRGIGLGLLGAVFGAVAIPTGKWVRVSPGSVSVSLAF
ncbi:MAG: hypothetical protein ABIR59_01130 [Gemmatimonadales bacterium]